MEGESALKQIFSDSEEDSSDGDMLDGDEVDFTYAPRGLDLYQVCFLNISI